MHDLLIRNATILDGLGGVGVVGDIAVDAERIVEVGEAGSHGRTEIDASGWCVSPGFIQSNMTLNIAEKVKMYLTSRIPMGRLGTGEDVSNCVAFLSSSQASYITGETIHVNGGMYMA